MELKDVPNIPPSKEDCGDNFDNEKDGLEDCRDKDCEGNVIVFGVLFFKNHHGVAQGKETIFLPYCFLVGSHYSLFFGIRRR